MMAAAPRGSFTDASMNGHRNGIPDGFEAPPSTMAAQLINNISTTKQPAQPASQDDLRLMMAEVASTANNHLQTQDPAGKIEQSHKLIYVLARALFEKLQLAGDDPFLPVQQMLPQASEALDYFVVAVNETPAVLKHTLTPGTNFPTRGNEPFWVWLFPRILGLLGRKDCEILDGKILGFFQATFQAVLRSPKLWELSSLFFLYLKECITTVLNHLQSNPYSFSQVVLPCPTKEETPFYVSDIDDLTDPLLHCTYSFLAAGSTFLHIEAVFAILINTSIDAAKSYDVAFAFQDYAAWILDSLLVMQHIVDQWKTRLGLSVTYQDRPTSTFRAYQEVLFSLQDLLAPSILRKGYASLTIISAQMLENPTFLTDLSVRLAFCNNLLSLASMCQRYSSMRSVVFARLLPVLQTIITDESTKPLVDNDFKRAVFLLCQASGGPSITLNDEILDNFQNQELLAEFRLLGLQELIETKQIGDRLDNSPPSKRRKIQYNASGPLEDIICDIYTAIGLEAGPGLDGLSRVIKNSFFSAERSDEDRCKFLENLGYVACGFSGYLELSGDAGQPKQAECLMCNAPKIPEDFDRNEHDSGDIIKEAVLALCEILQSPEFVSYRRPQITAMLALRRLALHSEEEQILSYEKSMAAQWCLQSLNSPIRELRIAAGRTIVVFLRQSLFSTLNRFYVIGILRDMSEKASIQLQETYILAWGQISRIAKDEQLCLIIRKLVEYLDNGNPIVAGTAVNEVIRLAWAMEVTSAKQMLKPFWGNVAILPVRNLLVRPQSTQMLADILGIMVPDFLLLTQNYTIPYLVLEGRSGIIKKISEARRERDDKLVLMDNENLIPTLALLLTQEAPDLEQFIQSSLDKVVAGFSGNFRTFEELLRQAEPARQALLLLQAAAEADDSQKSRIRFGLNFLAEKCPPKSAVDGTAKKNKKLVTFLQEHILGIVARLNYAIHDSRNESTPFERRRAVKTIEELVNVARRYSSAARPQITACLQIAFTQKELQGSAFSAWDTLLRTLDDEDVEPMMESTFAAIIQHWVSFEDSVRDKARSALEYLFKERIRLIRNTIVNLPSLSGLSDLAVIEAQLVKLRTPTDVENSFQIFARRLGNEDSGVVMQTLMELKLFLRKGQAFLQASAISEQPDAVVGQLIRALLDTCVKFNESDYTAAQLSTECLGLIGCLDSNRVESVRDRREMIVVSNFNDGAEAADFVLYTLEVVIVPEFLSARDTSNQAFLSYVMQELLERFEFKAFRSAKHDYKHLSEIWEALPDSVRETLSPFLDSKFRLQDRVWSAAEYPILRPEKSGSKTPFKPWVATFVRDLLRKHSNQATSLMFPVLDRAIRTKSISIAVFLLPYVVLYVIVEGSIQDRDQIVTEMLHVLRYEAPTGSQIRLDDLQLCVEAVFHVLDYLARWIQEKNSRASRSRSDNADTTGIDRVNSILKMIPPEIIAGRAMECKSYPRALFYWEQHIRNVRETNKSETTKTQHLQRLQDIYTQIDEPDGIDGISAQLHVLDIDQQVLAHRKAGRWTAAQSWYEIQLAETPDNVDIQLDLLSCLKESGQHDVLLNYVEGIQTSPQTVSKILPFAAEASWATSRWPALQKYTAMSTTETPFDFNVELGRSLLALKQNDNDQFQRSLSMLRKQIARSLSSATTSSLSSCHESMLRLHVLTDMEMIAGTDNGPSIERAHIIESLDRRLEVIGSYLNDKQYLLGIRRAAMQLSSLNFTKGDVAAAWLTSARLARKSNASHQSYNAVLHASQLGDASATIEHARLLWRDGHQRKAIQALKGAIETNAFISHDRSMALDSFNTGVEQTEQQNLLTASAHLLLAKWLDSAGQTQASGIRMQYQEAARRHQTWERGHYYLGRHYSKILEHEKAATPAPAGESTESYLRGDTARLVIESYLRALSYGTKYIYQTLPRILTLWLDLGTLVTQPIDTRYGNHRDFGSTMTAGRKANLDKIHERFRKYVQKMPAYMFYTALPQIVSRITHSNTEVFRWLQMIIQKVVMAHPQQALWSLLAVCTSTQSDRRARGALILNAVKNSKKADSSSHDIKSMIKNGEKLAEQLLLACNAGEFQGNRTIWATLTKDLGFNQKVCLPSMMAVPAQSVLTATLPTLSGNVREHKAFSRDIVTVHSFQDEVLVLSSLQKPRKLTAVGSDGKTYGLMCKPKDDLRKDQRLMEFNSMINRSLKRDAESSRRQLYIKTYAVTPLNEECGIIEWVDGLKTLRDILFALYKPLGIQPNYKEIELYCEEAIKSKDKLPFFTEKVLGQFPPVFHKWFVQQFPEPSTWFAARLRYTRSCAVMSMVGTILGLGDRHGENILFEEGNGGTFHVDFNCLFDKGLTFAKAERVPFRLTHNMVDAMGIYGYEGPFRKSSELTLKLLRQHEETLMTILEAFIYDPTLDLLSKKEKKKKVGAMEVPNTPQAVLDSIQRKIKGLPPNESVPLGVEGQVDSLIEQATNQTFLAGMYIGWCAFF